jgi:hypothetical protein
MRTPLKSGVVFPHQSITLLSRGIKIAAPAGLCGTKTQMQASQSLTRDMAQTIL